MSGSAGSGAARKFLKELLAGIFLHFAGIFLLIAYFSLDT